jgi:hypothetical protein
MLDHLGRGREREMKREGKRKEEKIEVIVEQPGLKIQEKGQVWRSWNNIKTLSTKNCVDNKYCSQRGMNGITNEYFYFYES